MKKLILSSVLLSGLLLSGAVVSQAADEVSAKSGNAETDVNITVRPDTGSEPTQGDYLGKLAIVYKPTAYNFSGVATGGQLVLDNKTTSKNKQYIVVNDDRDTNAGKWKLDGQLSEITKLDANGDPIARDLAADEASALNGSLVITVNDEAIGDGGVNGLFNYSIGTNTQTVNGVEDLVPADIVDGAAATAATGVAFGAGGSTKVTTLTLPADDATSTRILTSTATAKNGVAANLGNAKFIIDNSINNSDPQKDFHYKGTITWTVASNA